jgi:hypothetical protein
MDWPEVDERVAVWLSKAMPCEAAQSRRLLISNRHVLEASRLLQDATTSNFVDRNGEIVATYPTPLIIDVEWLATTEQRDDLSTRTVASAGRFGEPGELDLKDLAPGSVEWREAVSEIYPRAYKPWTFQEDEDLRREYADGLTIREIALRHERREGGISSRIKHLELER